MNNKVLSALVIAVVAIIILLTGGYFKLDSFSEVNGHNAGSAKTFKAFAQPIALKPLVLNAHNGTAFANEQLQGHWTLAFLGYTFCPDICPLTLSGLARIYPELESLNTETPIQILFISVDPNRDTPERLNEYVNYFNSDFIAATAPHQDLFPMVRDMRMMYAITDNTDNPNYFVDHSASVVVVNPAGEAVGRFKPKLKSGQPAVVDGQQILLEMPYIINGNI